LEQEEITYIFDITRERRPDEVLEFWKLIRNLNDRESLSSFGCSGLLSVLASKEVFPEVSD
jgi:hypothetical protein